MKTFLRGVTIIMKPFEDRKKEFLLNIELIEKDIEILKVNIERAKFVLENSESYEDVKEIGDVDLEEGLSHIRLF